MKRPLCVMCLFYITGIIAGRFDFTAIALIFVGIFLLAACQWFTYKAKIIFLFPFLFALGVQLFQSSIAYKNAEIVNAAREEKEITVAGVVKNVSTTKTGRQRIVLQCRNIYIDEYDFRDNICISVILGAGKQVSFNENIVIAGTLQFLDFQRNPGGYNEMLYMKSMGISYKMFGTVLAHEGIHKNFFYYVNVFREKILSIYDAVLPPREASIIKAMVLGDTEFLDETIQDLYAKTGISHILAISGLHISILSLFLYKLLLFLKWSKRKTSLIIIVFLGFYTVLCGARPSAVRAAVMTSIALFGNVLYEDSDSYTSIAAAAFFMLLYQPLFLFRISFQLSYGAVLGLVAFSKVLEQFPSRFKKYCGATFSASLFTYPLVAFYFYQISILGIVVNFLILPFISLLLCTGLAAGIVGLVSIQGATFFASVSFFILKFYEIICTFFMNIPYSYIYVKSPGIIFMLAYYGVLCLICLYVDSQDRKKIKVAILLGMVLLCIEPQRKSSQLVFLDVGQGDCAVITTKEGFCFVVDGGGNINQERNNNTGTYTLIPYLRYKGVKKIDGLFVSHGDFDHIGGLLEVIGVIAVDKIIIPKGEYTNAPLLDALKEKAQNYSIPVHAVGEGDEIFIREDFTFDFYYPKENGQYDGERLNDSSLVFKMAYGPYSVLFTGDVGKEGEQYILDQNAPIAADLLKVAHHGSHTSSLEGFIQKVSPSLAVISCGRYNTFGHPSQETLDTLETQGVPYLSTKDVGAVSFHFTNGAITCAKENNAYEGIKK